MALLEPQIAPNTGNIARLCAACGARLHLIGRLGFRLDERSLRRAGVDYWDSVDLVRHTDWAGFAQSIAPRRLLLFTAQGGMDYAEFAYRDEDCLVLGNESDGLPRGLLAEAGQIVLHIPMPTGKVRSLNLATAAGIALYEALRQLRSVKSDPR
jgi:tRNA (cytidine/uridine-2'-O-)-methyltransferase